MFKKILIANRGEIACRVMRSAHKMGIKPVAVYSDADGNALHVRTALELGGEAVPIGPAPSAESYLVMERIIEACKQTGAEAVHPGYGFLSENRSFAKALDEAGIAFIGPGVRAIEAMGDKIESKKLAQAAGVSTVPGHLEAVSDPEEAVRIANDIGYPVMLKASAGGGGKGMRLAWNDDEARRGLTSAMSEGLSSFGDDRVFIEKFIEQPRHIEIQVLADSHGNTLYLGERECSIQRRHQKVIEEAPSPFLDEKTRKAMGEQAVALAKEVDYRSAGTVEFIVDKNKNFYFLEMNTRLQVEHPVTELITGLDLVEWMIRIANGEKLDIKQKDVQLNGWAIEARLYAEDAERGFLPSTGRLVNYAEPDALSEDVVVRCDSGCYEGAEISIYYDPMISKLITWGKDRATAIDAMRQALDGYYVRGLSHNLPFLAHLAKHPRFATGDMTTNFIAEEYPEGLSEEHLMPQDPYLFAAIAGLIQERFDSRARHAQEVAAFALESAGGGGAGAASGAGFSIDEEAPARYTVFLGAAEPVEIGFRVSAENGLVHIMFDGQVSEGADSEADAGKVMTIETDWRIGQPVLKAQINNKPHIFQIDPKGAGYILSHDGARIETLVVETRHAVLRRLMPYKPPPDMSKFLLSPMPGLLVSVAVEEGQSVQAGQELAIVEAMKMENVLHAEQEGVVKSLSAAPGDSLAVDQIIIEFE